MEFGELPVGERMEMWGEWLSWRAHRSPAFFPHKLTCLVNLFHLAIPELDPFTIKW